MKNPLNKIVRSVQAFGRELKRPRPDAPAGQPPHTPRPKIGLALGGGFARGLAHIGILKVFEEEQIPIDFLAGTSVGALIGAGYASGVSAQELAEIASQVRFNDFSRWTFSRFGLFSNDKMSAFLHRTLRCKTFEDLRIPLSVTATDIVTGEPAVFTSGDLIDPVRASCAYPAMFQPVRIGDRVLVDGLLAYCVPVVPLRDMGAERVVAVHLAANWVKPRGPRHVFDVIGQCFSIAQDKMGHSWRGMTDIIVEPDIGEFGYDDFLRAHDLVKAGELAMRAMLPRLREWLPAPPRPQEGPASAATAIMTK